MNRPHQWGFFIATILATIAFRIMSFTFPDDQTRLQQVFGLTRDQLRSDSLLRYLMDEAEQFDADQNASTVDTILTLLDSLDNATTGLLVQETAKTGNYRSLSVSGEYSITNAPGGEALKISTKIEVAKSEILKLLDPDGKLFDDRYQCKVDSWLLRDRWGWGVAL